MAKDKECGLYAIVDEKDTVLYIGKTLKGFEERWNSHALNIVEDYASQLYHKIRSYMQLGHKIYFKRLLTLYTIRKYWPQDEEAENFLDFLKYFL